MNNKTFSFMNHSRNFDKVRKNHLIEVGIEWYDFACFGIVGATIISSLWILWMNEASARGKGASNNKCGDFEALNLDENDDENLLVMAAAATTPRRKQNSNINMNNELGISQLWTSCWEGVHPLWLLFTRFSSLVTMAALVSLDVLDYDASIFFYYTEWTFTLVMIYFSMGIIASAYGSWQSIKKPPIVHEEMSEFIKRKSQERVSSNKEITKDELKQGAVFWVYLVQVTYQTAAGAVILTDIVFWGLIFPFMTISHLRLNMLIMGLMHSMNAAFLLLDTALNNLPFPFFRIAYFVLWSCVYIIFQWIIHACGFSWWPYPFLELNSPWSPFWYLALGAIHIPCYAVYSLIVKAKHAILTKLFPQSFLG